MHDTRIARWLSVDPEGQHWSPYLSMGNDPNIRTDPNGGNDDPDPGYRYKNGRAYQETDIDGGKNFAEYLTAVTVTPGGKGSMQWFGFSMAYDKNYWQNKDKFYSRLYNKEKASLIQKGDSKSYKDQVQLFQNRHNAELDGRKFEAGFVATIFSPLAIYAAGTGYVAAAPAVSGMYSGASTALTDLSIKAWGFSMQWLNREKGYVITAVLAAGNKYLPSGIQQSIQNIGNTFTTIFPPNDPVSLNRVRDVYKIVGDRYPKFFK